MSNDTPCGTDLVLASTLNHVVDHLLGIRECLDIDCMDIILVQLRYLGLKPLIIRAALHIHGIVAMARKTSEEVLGDDLRE